MAIIVTEQLLGRSSPGFLGLEPQLLVSQLSSNLWRTLGTTVALTVGLGLYVAMMVWGYSMLQPFKPGDWVPDMLVAFQLGGLPDAEIDAVRHVEGVIPEQCIPLGGRSAAIGRRHHRQPAGQLRHAARQRHHDRARSRKSRSAATSR